MAITIHCGKFEVFFRSSIAIRDEVSSNAAPKTMAITPATYPAGNGGATYSILFI
tara:strand:+ start:553 stop:717 length:165 start_codon:yes stop_codon:yes gene_type:complete